MYLRVADPITKSSVTLLPWFMLARKKYPIFIYLFAYWCCRSQNKSVRESAAATKQLFGTEIHYSVISRSLNMAHELLDIEAPISTSKTAAIPLDDILKCVPNILTSPIDLSQPLQSGDNTWESALGNITLRFAKMVRPKSSRQAKSTPPTPATTRKKQKPETYPEEKTKKPPPKTFVSEKRIDRARKLFILLCHRLVLNAAIQYHKFLI
ncbi:MAG: hypothetical protein FWH55_14220 [Oscillospiraceae bacterium]|nr:hypothetical protein [Oscillospiraceae bacterium]